MDGDLLLEFSSSHFRHMSEPDAIRFLHEVSNAQLSPEVNDSSDSRDGLPTSYQANVNGEHFRSAGAVNNAPEDIVHTDHSMDKPVHTRYRECMSNHAAALGGHSVDGCGEFIPSGIEGLDSFKCAACSCHRNFHRKEVDGSTQGCSYCGKDPKRPMTPTQLAPVPASANGGAVLPLNFPRFGEPDRQTIHKKKRHRTIFTLEQKERMFFFAENLGWRILKHDEESVQSFCDDVGVPRRIFRVWMHNHKHSMKRQ